MAIRLAQRFLGRIFTQRCFYLFVVLLAFDTILPFTEPGRHSGLLITAANCFVIVSAVAAVGRTLLSFVIISLLAFATVFFFWSSVKYNDPTHLVRAWGFGAALDLATIVYL